MKVKACPHCGERVEDLDKRMGRGVLVYKDAPASDWTPWDHVACLLCGSGSPSIEVWNQRVNERKK